MSEFDKEIKSDIEKIISECDAEGKCSCGEIDFCECKNFQSPWDFEDYNMSCDNCITPFNIFNED